MDRGTHLSFISSRMHSIMLSMYSLGCRAGLLAWPLPPATLAPLMRFCRLEIIIKGGSESRKDQSQS